jgi:hypothetical protein
VLPSILQHTHLHCIMNPTRIIPLLASAVVIAATAAQAAVISIPDYNLVPDGSNYGSSNAAADTQNQKTDVTAAAGGTIVNSTRPIAYFVTTFSFGTGTSAEINLNFAVSNGADRLGVKVRANGTVSSTGDGSDTSSDYNFGASLVGQTVTLIGKFDFNADYSVDYGQSNASNDTFATFWINPTGSDTEGSGWTLLPGTPPTTPNPNFSGDFASAIWNSSSFSLVKQRINNNSTPGTAGTSSILNTTILTGTDATFANALALAIPEPSAALLGGPGLLALLRRRRNA